MIPKEIGVINMQTNNCSNHLVQVNQCQNEIFRNYQSGHIVNCQYQGINQKSFSNTQDNSISYQQYSNNLINILANVKDHQNQNQYFHSQQNNLQCNPSTQNMNFSLYQINKNMMNYSVQSHPISLPLQNVYNPQQMFQMQNSSQFATVNSIQQKQDVVPQNNNFNAQQDKFMNQVPINNMMQQTYYHPTHTGSYKNIGTQPELTLENQSLFQELDQPALTSDNYSVTDSQEKNIQVNEFGQEQNEELCDQDLFGEDTSESEQSFWNYQQPDQWKQLLEMKQNNLDNQIQKQKQKRKQKLQENDNQHPLKQTKKNKKSKNNLINNEIKPVQIKDPFFGIKPINIQLKDFPQCSNDEFVFQWWEQVDDIYFPIKIKESYLQFLNQNNFKLNQIIDNNEQGETDESEIVDRIPPLSLLLTQQFGSNLSENSSNYYLMTKDHVKNEVLPFKQPNYFTVLFCDGFNLGQSNESNDNVSFNNINKRLTINSLTWGVLAVYKLKYYDQKRQLSLEDRDIFDQVACQLDVVSANEDTVEKYFQKLDQQIQVSNSIVYPNLTKNKKQNKNLPIQREPQNLNRYEPNICKKFIGNNQIVQISQIQKQSNCKEDFDYDKNKISIKLKKLISLDKQAIYSALQQQNYLNLQIKRSEQAKKIIEFQKNKKIQLNNDDDSDFEYINEYYKFNNLNDSPIERNILSLEYELSNFYATHKIQEFKQNIIDKAQNENNYLELRQHSIRINDNLKWLTIRKNLIAGFSDRNPFDTKYYFKYESEEKIGTNISREQIIQEKEQFGKMNETEFENISKIKLESAAQEVKNKQQQQLDRLRRQIENKQIGSIKTSSNLQIRQNIQIQNQDETVVKDEELSNQSNENIILTENQAIENNRSETSLIGHNQINKDSVKQEEDGKISQAQNNNKKKRRQKQKKVNKLFETDCSVCFHYANNENNTVVYCSQCNASFHKHCYGIDFIPEEKFLCRKCQHKNISQKKKNNYGYQQHPQKDELIKFYQCKICNETQLPVISIYDDNQFYHPTCLFIFNYAIYHESMLQLRNEITHQSISTDIQNQSHISCQICQSNKGLKVKCCQFEQPCQFQNPCVVNNHLKRQHVIMQEIEAELITQNIYENKNQLTEELNEQSTLTQSLKIEQDAKSDDRMQDETELVIKQNFKQYTENINNMTLKQEILNETQNNIRNDNMNKNDCNYYVHPLCAYLNGMEIWLDSRNEDIQCEKNIFESDFQDLKHLGLKILFKCYQHADKINRNYDEQIYYRRFQINYKNICQYETFQDYKNQIKKQISYEEEQMNMNILKQKEYQENLSHQYLEKLKQKHRNHYQNEEKIQIKQETIQEQVHDNLKDLKIKHEFDEAYTPNNKSQNGDTNESVDKNKNNKPSSDEESEIEIIQKKRRQRRKQQRRLFQIQTLNEDDNQNAQDSSKNNEEKENDRKRGQQNHRRKKQLKDSVTKEESSTLLQKEGGISQDILNRIFDQKSKISTQNIQNVKDEEIYDQSFSKDSSFNDISLRKKQQKQKSQQSDPAEIISNLAQIKQEQCKLEEEQEEEFVGITKKNNKINSNQTLNQKNQKIHSNSKNGNDSQNSQKSDIISQSLFKEDHSQDKRDKNSCKKEFISINKKDMKPSQNKKKRKEHIKNCQ